MKTLELKKNFYWTGILDPGLRVFDIIMNTEFGTTYNSYLVKGSEKTVLFETAKAKCMEEYMDKLTSLVDIKDIDYIVVNHTEPDHAGSAEKLIEINPAIKLVGTATALKFMKEITNTDFTSVIVKEGDTLS
ncbi:MAG: MBL fold metallo-hydrolase, partial [Anaerovoracaceae bacterium]